MVIGYGGGLNEVKKLSESYVGGHIYSHAPALSAGGSWVSPLPLYLCACTYAPALFLPMCSGGETSLIYPVFYPHCGELSPIGSLHNTG